MNDCPDLLACYWTLAGAYQFGEHDESPWDFRDRAEAAGRAGYKGFGFKHADLRRGVARYGFGGIRAILADNGLVHVEVEALFDWFADGAERRRSDVERAELLVAAEALGAHRLKAAGGFTHDSAVPVARMHDAFQVLAKAACDVGTVAVLEPIAFSTIPDIATALAIIGDSAGRGGGLMLDIWHMTRAGSPWSAIAALPRHAIGGVELNDGTPAPVGDPLSDTLDRRRLCGAGGFDVAGFIAATRSTGYDGPWGVEIISSEQRARPLAEAADLSFTTTARAFAHSQIE